MQGLLQLITNKHARWVIYPLLLAALWFWQGPRLLHAGPNSGLKNGFDLSNALVSVSQIKYGGSGRDGIPAIDQRHFIDVSQADFLNDTDRVLGINLHAEQKAYPIRILNYHEIVNDRFGDTAVLVSYCPLCGTGMAFLAERNSENFEFGVSGLLYNSDVLLYDRQTESLWLQIRKQAIAGPLKGQQLQQIPLEHTRWSDWRARYPHTLLMWRSARPPYGTSMPGSRGPVHPITSKSIGGTRGASCSRFAVREVKQRGRSLWTHRGNRATAPAPTEFRCGS